ncbi:MAG: ferrochelatase [Rhodospirillales bacterium]|nr:ferrochelatase [Rhodospirillales bacterium]
MIETPKEHRLAVVLFNLGGPDRLEAVRPFLFNLFNDKAIIGAPAPVRRLLAEFISRRRAPLARAIYREIGGGSPLLERTRQQAAALERRLSEQNPGGVVRVFVCMRYWHPMSAEVASEVAAFAPDDIVLLPLYPQFSTTTTASSVADWQRAASDCGIGAETRAICCYPNNPGLIAAQAALVRNAYETARPSGRPRILFSAHGLPERVVARGDPYAWQVEQTVTAVVDALAIADLDHVICYQSRVGPLKWIGPDTERELEKAGRDGVPVVLVPISFVSEHSETLVELDITYRDHALLHGVDCYVRVPAVGVAGAFIDGLADLVGEALVERGGVGNNRLAISSSGGRRLCPPAMSGCACSLSGSTS